MTCHMPAAGNEWGSFTLAPGDMTISFLRLSAANWKVAERQNPWASNYRTKRAWKEAPGPTGWGVLHGGMLAFLSQRRP